MLKHLIDYKYKLWGEIHKNCNCWKKQSSTSPTISVRVKNFSAESLHSSKLRSTIVASCLLTFISFWIVRFINSMTVSTLCNSTNKLSLTIPQFLIIIYSDVLRRVFNLQCLVWVCGDHYLNNMTFLMFHYKLLVVVGSCCIPE
ncbi:hypothetical protein CW304_00490 [Bacillus sp. UFRGS-B20]|nr:hypothetical protein CW304_00490 [Bacillus sp. UFRGS-B20]